MSPPTRRHRHHSIRMLLLSALVGCSSVRVDPEIQSDYDTTRAEMAAALDAARAPVEADQQALAASLWMHDRECTDDVSSVLHPLIGFSSSAYTDAGLLPPPALTEEQMDQLYAASEQHKQAPEGEHWMKQGGTPEVQAVTVPWMASLRSFDCWNVTANHPWAALDPEVLFTHRPMPNGAPLHQASMVRLMQLHAPTADSPEADMAAVRQALEEVRHLATLCIQSQEMVLMIVGVTILEREREAVEFLSEQGRVPDGWQPISQESTDRLKRLVFVAPNFAHLFTPSQHHDLITDAGFAVGRCAGIREGLHASIAFDGLLEPDQFVWLDSVLEQAADLRCNLDDLKHLRSSPEIKLIEHEDLSSPLMTRAKDRSVAMVLASLSVPPFGLPYEAD